ncbi:SURF1 family protein [Microbulbifer epialgicus]|uniref:SURF1-like protein n=1 Tax=Microbulbifer epialgicus TaxID=393907 RepID=A0ABV4NV94_9GAMM
MTLEIPSVSAKKNSVPLIRNWPITIFSAVLLPLLISLGFWQLQRAEEKALIVAEVDSGLSAQPISPVEGTVLNRFTPVILTGKYSEEIYFLDNRTRRGRAGYEVLQVFNSNDRRWLINRGWVAMPLSRKIYPEITYPKTMMTIIGFLHPIDDKYTQTSYKKLDDRRVQYIDSWFADEIKLTEKLWVVRLTADSHSALETGWNLVNSSPDRHRAYSVQWFSMSIALVILWMFAATNFARLSRNKITRKS